MRLEMPDLNLLAKADEVRIAAHWLSQRRRWSIYESVRGWSFSSVESLLDASWGQQGAERYLKMTVSPALVVRSRRRTRIFQLLSHSLEVDWVATSWSVRESRLSASWDARQCTRLTRLLREVASAFPIQMLATWLRDAPPLEVALLPRAYRMPRPLAAWLTGANKRILKSGWDEDQVRRWAING